MPNIQFNCDYDSNHRLIVPTVQRGGLQRPNIHRTYLHVARRGLEPFGFSGPDLGKGSNKG